MWKDIRFIVFLFVLCLALAIYDRWSGAFFLPPWQPPQVLGESTQSSP